MRQNELSSGVGYRATLLALAAGLGTLSAIATHQFEPLGRGAAHAAVTGKSRVAIARPIVNNRTASTNVADEPHNMPFRSLPPLTFH